MLARDAGGRPVPVRAELVARLEAELARRLRELPEARRDGFVSSELDVAHAALSAVRDRGLARGPVFCDWGSGLGAVCALAAALSFEAYGIEIQAVLVAGARELVGALGLSAAFAHGSFLQPGDEGLVAGSGHLRVEVSGDPYGALGITAAGCDVVFAFPWPGEEALYDRMFSRHATPGALLLTFHDCAQVLVQRRTDDPHALQPLGWLGGRGV